MKMNSGRIRTCEPRSLDIDRGRLSSAINSHGYHRPERRLRRFLGHAVQVVIVYLSAIAHAADTLPSVSPPTDWTGVGIAVGLAVLIVGAIALIQYWRRPGIQRGEAAFNKLYELLGSAHETIAKQADALASKTPEATYKVNVQPGSNPATARQVPAPPAPTKFPWPDQ